MSSVLWIRYFPCIHLLVGGIGIVSRLGAVLQNAPVDICINVGVDVFFCLGKMSRGKIVGLTGCLYLTFLGSKLFSYVPVPFYSPAVLQSSGFPPPCQQLFLYGHPNGNTVLSYCSLLFL